MKKMAESYLNRQKTLWEKKKLLITSNFSFSHSVFKRLIFQGHQKVSLRGNGLTLHKFLDLSKLNAFAEDKIKVTQYLKFVLESIENIVERGEYAGYQHFLLFPQCFKDGSFSGSLKSRCCGKGLKHLCNAS